jgi:predicted DNA-binding ribbon-helix-helix protein
VLNPRRIDIHGRPASFRLEPEYWVWLKEIAAKTETTIKAIIEAIAATRNPHRSLASEIRVAVAAYFHGNPYPIYRCPAGLVPMRNGDVSLGWPGGRRRAQEGPRSTLVDQVYGTRKPRSASRSASRLSPARCRALRAL